MWRAREPSTDSVHTGTNGGPACGGAGFTDTSRAPSVQWSPVHESPFKGHGREFITQVRVVGHSACIDSGAS